MKLKVFLNNDVETLGLKHEIVEVTQGYYRNFLEPHRLAEPATFAHEKMAEEAKKRMNVIAKKTTALASKLEGAYLVLKKKAHDN
ncbi:MAG: bL9 family ribosomal protein, partial [Candidatus Babeliales bacterium]